jgi:hypothetical protein
MINTSRRCFTCGMLSLLPVIGIPFAVAALVYAGKVRVAEKQLWNPARPYMMIGGIVASLSLILWTFDIVLTMWNLRNPGPG